MTQIATIKLPCSAAALERVVLRAASQGHWHDAEIRLESDNRLVVFFCDHAPPNTADAPR